MQAEVLVSHKEKVSKSKALELCKKWEWNRMFLLSSLDLLQDLGLAYPQVTRMPLFYEKIISKGLQRC